MLNFLLSLILSSFAVAHAAKTEPGPNLKWDLEVRDVSRRYRKEMYPSGLVDAWWAAPHYNKKSGLLRTDAPRAYRHMHAMVVARFYARRKDQRDAAREWLQGYKCENVIACDDYYQFYDGALKASVLTLKEQAERDAEDAFRKKIKDSTAAMLNRKPPTSGLCAPASDRAGWLELEYELFCPTPETPRQYGLCPGCALTDALKLQLEMDSQQMVLSSSFVDKFEHRGSANCTKPWKAWLRCGGGITASYTVHCERKGTSVICAEKRKTAKR